MIPDNCEFVPLSKLRPFQLLGEMLRTAVEETVSEYLCRNWKVRTAKDMSEYACHHCAILSDGVYAVFVKYAEEEEAPKQFACEIDGLQYLSEEAHVLIPTPISIVPVENGTLFIIEALKIVERTPLDWRKIGRTLSRIHRVNSDRFGFHSNGYLGPVPMDNTPTKDWVSFYQERRLSPMLKKAIDSENLPISFANQVEKLILRLPELCDNDLTPSLLHGDAQQNNFISSEKGTYIIDPAIYYGNPEIDLALIDCWQPVPDEVFRGYKEEMPIDSGFIKRRNLWRISIYLVAVTLEGSEYLTKLSDALKEYV